MAKESKKSWKLKPVKGDPFESKPSLRVYHGTNREFEKFDPNAESRYASRSPYENGTAFFARTPEEASAYGPRVLPADLELGKSKTFDVKHLYKNDPKFLEKIVEAHRELHPHKADEAERWVRENHKSFLEREKEGQEMYKAGYEGLDPELKAEIPFEPPEDYPGLASGARDAVMKTAREEGLDTAIIRNLQDVHGTGDQIAVLNPKKIKFLGQAD